MVTTTESIWIVRVTFPAESGMGERIGPRRASDMKVAPLDLDQCLQTVADPELAKLAMVFLIWNDISKWKLTEENTTRYEP